MKRLSEADIVKLIGKKRIIVEDSDAELLEEDEELVNPQVRALEDIAVALGNIQSANRNLTEKLQEAIQELVAQLKVDRSPTITIPPPEVNVSVPAVDKIIEWEFVIIRDSKGLIEKITAIAK